MYAFSWDSAKMHVPTPKLPTTSTVNVLQKYSYPVPPSKDQNVCKRRPGVGVCFSIAHRKFVREIIKSMRSPSPSCWIEPESLRGLHTSLIHWKLDLSSAGGSSGRLLLSKLSFSCLSRSQFRLQSSISRIIHRVSDDGWFVWEFQAHFLSLPSCSSSRISNISNEQAFGQEITSFLLSAKTHRLKQ